MKQYLNTIICSTAMTCMSLLAGCTKDLIEESDKPSDGKTITALFTLSPEAVEEIDVRSIAGVDERLIKDLWVIQLNAAGSALLQDPQYITTGFTSTSTDYKVSIPLKREVSKIYFITNTHSPSAYTGATKTAAVEAVTKEITAEADLASADGIPMAGVWTGTPDLLGIAGRVSLSRAVAKVNFNLNALLPHGEKFTLESVTVKQVPQALNYYRDAATLDTYPYPATPSVMDYPATTYSNVNLIASPQVLWWYLPENARGKGTASIQTDKGVKFPTDPTNQSAYCTYIEVKGWYEAANGTYETTYKIYLGANNTTDYNLKRNTLYNVNTTIRGIDAADTRINTVDKSIIVGMFGGWDDTKKEYTKLLEVQSIETANDPLLEWAKTEGITGAANLYYGPTNIDLLKSKSTDLSAYPAAKYCADKGNGWYLPAQNQMLAVWIALESIPTSFSLVANTYWSTLEDNSDNSRYISFSDGTVSNALKKTTGRVRCVRDITLNGKESPKIVIATNNRVIIDSREMPAKSISTSKARGTQASNSASSPDKTSNDIASAESNKTISYYFEVAPNDLNSGATKEWLESVQGCQNYDSGDNATNGNWRLPTQRELLLIWTISTLTD